jgi:CRP-like cAMP-binding protein
VTQEATEPRLRPRNRLLLALPEDDCAAILAEAECVTLRPGMVLQEALSPAAYAWFPEDGLASYVAVMEDGSMIEAASVGLEGFVGISLVLGNAASSIRVIWQVPGSANRIPAAVFTRLYREGRFGSTLGVFIADVLGQMAQVAGCNRRHVIVQRAARWLLMTHDRVDGDRFLLTHEFLATMLGAGRPKVTLAAQRLQAAGLITYRRGVVTIEDREGLERAACECYRVLARSFPGSERQGAAAGSA